MKRRSIIAFHRLFIFARVNVFDEVIKMDKTKTEFNEQNEEEDDITIYSRYVRDLLLDDDELSPIEDAFMNGYDEAD